MKKDEESGIQERLYQFSTSRSSVSLPIWFSLAQLKDLSAVCITDCNKAASIGLLCDKTEALHVHSPLTRALEAV